jgi:hypothetical protein
VLRRHCWGWLVCLACGIAIHGGCQSGPPRLVSSPLSAAEQQQAVLKIAPLGTPRDEALERLKEAGIVLSPGSNASIYYCDVWNREGGERWYLNVALLFDASGQLYLTRPAQAETGLASDSATALPTTSVPATPRARQAESPASTARGAALRTPFAEAQ